MINIFIIDDHPMVIEGIKSLLADSKLVFVVGSAADGFLAIEKLTQLEKLETAPGVALVDINLPELDGIELTRKLKIKFPTLKILGLSTFKERSYITRMLEAGASGYLLKNASKEELEEAIVAAFRGRMYMSMEATSILTKPEPVSNIPLLTAREKEVLELISDGFTNIEIAEKLFISSLTVDSHRKNLLAKFNVKNTAAMVKFAIEYKLI